MSRMYRFDCPRCGYSSRCAGGTTRHASFEMETVVCEDCRELRDIVTSIRLQLSPFLLSKLRREGRRMELSREVIRDLDGKFELPIEAFPPERNLILRRKDTTPIPRGMGKRWFTIDRTCPSNPVHRLKPWKSPCRCPKCNDWLERCLLPFREWD